MKLTSDKEKRRIFDSLHNPDRPIYKIAHAHPPNNPTKPYSSKKFLATSRRLMKQSMKSAKRMERGSEMICKIADCYDMSVTKGLCNKHYLRLKRYGDPLAVGRSLSITMKWVYQNKTFGGQICLFWPFARDKYGYGRIRIGKRKTGAHRLMCELHHGPPPSAKHEAAHSCGKGHLGCVNPHHLSWKTADENRADMISHGTKLGRKKSPAPSLMLGSGLLTGN